MRAQALASLVMDSDLGPLLLAGTADGVVAVRFVGPAGADAERETLAAELDAPVLDDDEPVLHRARRQLVAWLAGRRRAFALPLDLRGTPFQRRVWDALCRIPYGETRTYQEVAAAIGQPAAVRAVAHACGRNRVLIVVPCHRVLGADGRLTGYSGGLERKRRLLALERGVAPHLPLFEVAARRADDATRHAAGLVAGERLPEDVRGWIDARAGEHLAAGTLDPERFIAEAVQSLGPEDVPALAGLAAEQAVESGDPALREAADELLGAAATHLLTAPPGPQGVRTLLRAALALDSPWYEVLGRRLAALPRLPAAARDAALGIYEDVLAGELRASPLRRERTVDLWAALRHRAGDEAWQLDRSDDPSAALSRAGLWWEAAAEAERALAEGRGARRALLERLADLYARLGQPALASERLAALVAEDPRPELVARLRALEDRLRPDE